MFDSDAVISTNDPTLLRLHVPMLPIVCEQSSGGKVKITETLLRKSNANGFGNDVGSITNKVTAMYDVLASLEKGSVEYETLMDRILCGQAYQQESIDKIKGIKAKEMPKSWYDYKVNKVNIDYETGEVLDSEEVVKKKEFNLKIMVNKKPYFFIYNYPRLKKEYKGYMEKVNSNSILNFGLTLEELKDKPELDEEEEYFLKDSKIKTPVFTHASTMNNICHYIEEEFKDVRLKVKDSSDFDYTILLKAGRNPSTYKEIMEGIEELYKEYKDGQICYHNKIIRKKGNLHIGGSDDIKNNNSQQLEMFKEVTRIRASEICSSEDLLADLLVMYCYGNKKDKNFAWLISGEVIIKNLFEKNDKQFYYPIEDKNGDILWKGKAYSLDRVKLLEEDKKDE